MADNRTGRREDRRAFRPTLDGKLEARVLMAAHLSAIRAQTAANGQAVVITNQEGVRFFVSVAFGGTVRATAATGGRVNLVVDGTTPSSLLEINLVVPGQPRGLAHTFNTTQSTPVKQLNIASIRVTSGMINAIEGYQTANLSGAIIAAGTTRVDRIALNSILPGGSIQVGGDLNTLDVYNNVTLSGGNLTVGRDLNWFQTFGNVSLSNNARITIGRDLGLTLQPPKGSGNFGQGLFISGNLTIAPGSNLIVGRTIVGGVLIQGNFSGVSRFSASGFTPFNPAFPNQFPVTVGGTPAA